MSVSDQALQKLQQILLDMPPVKAMAIVIDRFTEDGHLRLSAPLQANVNDKHNAFGGSLTSLMTLACWSWFTLKLEAEGHAADVYVADSQVRYLAPVYEDLVANAGPELRDDWPGVLAFYRRRGKARMQMSASVVLADGTVAATFTGRFVAMAKDR